MASGSDCVQDPLQQRPLNGSWVVEIDSNALFPGKAGEVTIEVILADHRGLGAKLGGQLPSQPRLSGTAASNDGHHHRPGVPSHEAGSAGGVNTGKAGGLPGAIE